MAQRSGPGDPSALGRFGDAITRRCLLARGAGAGTAVLAAHAGSAAILPGDCGLRPALFLVERGIAGAAALTVIMAAGSVRIVEFDGDVGGPWIEAVRPLWHHAPAPIAGLTGEGARFCIEQLGRSAGLAGTFRCTYSASAAAAVGARLLHAGSGPVFPAQPATAGSASAWLLQPVTRLT